jgi:hypothetical protein
MNKESREVGEKFPASFFCCAYSTIAVQVTSSAVAAAQLFVEISGSAAAISGRMEVDGSKGTF